LPGDIVDDSIVVSEETAGGCSFRSPVALMAPSSSSPNAWRLPRQQTRLARPAPPERRDADVGRLVRITAGKGLGQIREVASNTAEQWTVTANWNTIPDATSLFEVIEANIGADETLGVVTQLPALSTHQGYLVRLNAQGVPYIDYTQPLTVSRDRGVPLPSMLAPVGGTVRYSDGDEEALDLTSYGKRYQARSSPAAYVVSGSLFLCGDEATGRTSHPSSSGISRSRPYSQPSPSTSSYPMARGRR
jgi:hypothetical protein